MRLKKSYILFLITLILLNISIVFSTTKNNYNTQNFFRIHVVANSDSIDDQLLKYNVAKEVETYITTLTKESSSKEESKQIIQKNIHSILNMCNAIIIEQGYTYNVKAYIGKLEYDEKQKDNIYMTSGIYDSLKIVIGNGNGTNWWSLIYPTSLNYEILDPSNSEQVEYKLHIVEWFKELFNM